MKFEINNTEWNIKTVDEATINNEMKEDGTLGVTIYKTQEILLLENQANIIKTLKHELIHVWLYEYGHSQRKEPTYDSEDVCEIVASSNDFINKVIEEYKEESQKCLCSTKSWEELSEKQRQELLEKMRQANSKIIFN